ncbi:hypothetical protein [Qipengyuania sp. NPDC077563]|uniref:hypothetical protein n=1 Tax=Qipengyuania sp. NPDC077563 TaxID=3364497 RepID=UPI00384FBE8F
MITGTADTVEPFALDPQSHVTYFECLPAGERTLLVVDGASHNSSMADSPITMRRWTFSSPSCAPSYLTMQPRQNGLAVRKRAAE